MSDDLGELLSLMLQIEKRVEALEKFEISSRERIIELFKIIKNFYEEILKI